MSIKYKLITSYLILLLFSISILGFFIVKESRTTVFNEVTEKSKSISDLIYSTVTVRNDLLLEKVKTDLHYARKLIENFGEIRIDYSKKIEVNNLYLPTIHAGNTNLTVDTRFIDDIMKSTGAIATVFSLNSEKLIRCTTNIYYNETRATGTYISDDSVIYKKIINNESYYGLSYVLNDYYIAAYEPLTDESGNIVGAIALGYKVLNPHLAEIINDIEIGQTGYVYVINSKGDLLIHPNIQGENLIDSDFIKEIIENKNDLIEYTYKGIDKLATYRYFEPWDWYIVATANYDDLKSSPKSIVTGFLLVSFIIFVIGVILALLLTKVIITPLNNLKKHMERIAITKDLTLHSDFKANDEIGMLSISFNHMITENKRLLEETIKYDRLKTEFFSNISHELKTPLNIIFSTTQLINLYACDDNKTINMAKLNKHITIINQNGYRLLKLVNNLIDITKIDSGFMDLNLKNENIIKLLEDITLSTVEYVESKSRTIIYDPYVEEKNIACDAEKIERIMLNLISNAVKFTKPGDKIEVKVYEKDTDLYFSVKDTGIGIPEDKQKEIFERFKQVDPLLSRRHEGSGIGLSLVKSLVEMHDGKITVKSSYGQGTEFVIRLPNKLITQTSTPISECTHETGVEKIQLEFSDIYS